jgi:hypothetical protein
VTRLVLDRPRAVLAAIYAAMYAEPSEQALALKHNITWDSYYACYRDSVVVGLEMDGELAGGMFFHLPGMAHIGIVPRFRARWVRWLKPMLEIGFEKYGPRLTALVNARNMRAQKFIEGVGCVKVRAMPECIEYDVIRERMRYGFVRK